MHTYVVVVKYSNNGTVWNSSTFTISANSASEAKSEALSRVPFGYSHVRVVSVSQIG